MVYQGYTIAEFFYLHFTLTTNAISNCSCHKRSTGSVAYIIKNYYLIEQNLICSVIWITGGAIKRNVIINTPFYCAAKYSNNAAMKW